MYKFPHGYLNVKYIRASFFILLVSFGVVVYWPSHNLLSFLIQGDLGRDLYAYQRTALGAIPYRDYYYTYGPLMPYYYALFFKLFGFQIPSILLGMMVLNILSGIIVYLSLSLFIEPILAVLATMWFWAFCPQFHHTFSHVGGVFVILLTVHFLLRYAKQRDRKWIHCMTLGILALLLIKINMGVVVLLASLLSVGAINILEDKSIRLHKIIYPSTMLIFPALTAAVIYGILMLGLPGYYIKQCLPFLPGYNQFAHSIPLSDALRIFIKEFLAKIGSTPNDWDQNALSLCPGSLSYSFLKFLFIFANGSFLYFSFFHKSKHNINRNTYLIIFIFSVFVFFLMHEYILSPSAYNYYWAIPLFILLTFFIAGIGIKPLHLVYYALLGATLLIIILGVQGKYLFKETLSRNPQQFIPNERVRIYVQNPPEWIETVTKTMNFLKTHLKPQETFVAFPYEPLYYYLTDRPSPVRETIIFDSLMIPKEQEERIISDLNIKKVNYFLLSNRYKSSEWGLGEFGKTYCPILAEYIKNNFKIVETFGDWSQPPTAIWGHAVRIYKRVSERH